MEANKKCRYPCIALLAIILIAELNQLSAQIVIDEPPERIYYDRTMRVAKFRDMKDMRDVFHYNKFLLGKNRIIGNISYNTGRVLIDDGHNIHKEYRSAIGFYTRIRFLEEFSFNTTFFKDFNPKASARWIADYSYSIGRYNWRPNKFNYGYENYINNKYSDNFKTFSEKFMEGYYFVSFSHSLSEKAIQKIKLDSTTSLKLTYFTRYSIKYRDENEVTHGGLFDGKSTIGAAFRFTMFWNIYIESAVYFYVDPNQKKQPWDPDYTYGFGYFDWRSFRFSLTYGNWAINSFPWNKTAYPQYGFVDGNFRFVANYIW
jgi:mRNA-degrading endonuclease HigB of HigAB toxin-antitoxin module